MRLGAQRETCPPCVREGPPAEGPVWAESRSSPWQQHQAPGLWAGTSKDGPRSSSSRTLIRSAHAQPGTGVSTEDSESWNPQNKETEARSGEKPHPKPGEGGLESVPALHSSTRLCASAGGSPLSRAGVCTRGLSCTPLTLPPSYPMKSDAQTGCTTSAPLCPAPRRYSTNLY